MFYVEVPDDEDQDQTIHPIIPNSTTPTTPTTPIPLTPSIMEGLLINGMFYNESKNLSDMPKWKTEMSIWDHLGLLLPFALLTKANMIYNSQISVSDTINGQKMGNWANMRFGATNIGFSGCEVIAVYNAMQLLYKSVSLASVIYEFDLNEAYLLLVQGIFGGDFIRFGQYFSAHDVYSKGTFSLNTLNLWVKKGGVYIISFWNTDKVTKGIHTVAVQYDGWNYLVYNRFGDSVDIWTYNSFSECINELGGMFIYG